MFSLGIKLMHVTNVAIFIGYQTYKLLMSLRNVLQVLVGSL